MKDNNLLQDFLDAALPDNLQKELFDKLAQDKELRRELKINMGIEKIARLDRASYKIPAELTQSVFSDLGIAFPVPNKSGNRKGLVLVMALLLLGFLVAGGSYLVYTNYFSKPVPVNEMAKAKTSIERKIPIVNSIAINSESYEKGYSAGKNDAIKSITARINRLNSNNLSNSNGNSHKSKFNEQSQSNANNGLLAYAEDANSVSGSPNSPETVKSNSFERIERVSDNISSMRTNYSNSDDLGLSQEYNSSYNQPQLNGALSLYPINLMNSYRETKWNISLRKLPTKSLNQSSLQANNAIYANTAFGASYNLSRSNSFGVEFGYENFSQQFTLEGGTLNYDQNPLMLWYGGFWNYTPQALNIAGFIQPYTQVFVGGTSVGPLLKAQAGISVNLIRNVYLNIGAEYGMLIYKVESNYYNSRNVGGTMGLKFSF
ncbi:MAG: hypothetical protein WCR42_02210 [bacterium]